MENMNSPQHCKLIGKVRIDLNNIKSKDHYEILDISSNGIEIVTDINYTEELIETSCE